MDNKNIINLLTKRQVEYVHNKNTNYNFILFTVHAGKIGLVQFISCNAPVTNYGEIGNIIVDRYKFTADLINNGKCW